MREGIRSQPVNARDKLLCQQSHNTEYYQTCISVQKLPVSHPLLLPIVKFWDISLCSVLRGSVPGPLLFIMYSITCFPHFILFLSLICYRFAVDIQLFFFVHVILVQRKSPTNGTRAYLLTIHPLKLNLSSLYIQITTLVKVKVKSKLLKHHTVHTVNKNTVHSSSLNHIICSKSWIYT